MTDNERAKQIISIVIACAGGWAVAPGEEAVKRLELQIEEILLDVSSDAYKRGMDGE